jgi:type I restriction enzyme, S subunit
MTKLPNSWSWSTLAEQCDLYQPKTISKEMMIAGGLYEVYGANGVIGMYNEYNHEDSEVLLSCRGNCGTVNVSKPKSWINGNAMVCRPKNSNLLKNYLRYYLESLNFAKIITGTAQQQITREPLSKVEIAIPPIYEQHKIVEILEDHLSRLDVALADVKQAKIKAAQFRKSLLQSIFEGKYSPNSNNWERKAIGDFAEVKGGKRLPKGTKWSDEPTRHPYIRATDIKFGKIKIEGLVHVPDSVWKSISRYVVEENDVVITIAGTIGEIAVVPSSLAGANLTENAAKLVFDHEYVLPSFLSMYLQSPSVQQEFKDLSKATTQAKLALYRIATVEIPVPTLHEQQEIIELVDEKLTYLISSLNQIADVELHVASLRRSLLQAAFTGQLSKEVVSV